MNLISCLKNNTQEVVTLDSFPLDEKTDLDKAINSYPESVKELSEIEIALENDTDLNTIRPRPTLKGRVIDNIVNLQKEQVMNINDLPLINRYSSHNNWLKLAKNLEKISVDGGKAFHVLRDDEDVLQLLVTTTADIDDERHPDVIEGLLILEGECKFMVAGNIRVMKEGDFVEIPINRVHNLKLITPSITAILQKIKF